MNPVLSISKPSTVPFAEKADQLRKAVRAYIGRRVSNPTTADDLTQDVFSKVVRQLPQVRDSRRLLGWILRIAHNTVIDHFRGRRRDEFLDANLLPDGLAKPEAIGREEERLREDLNAYVRSIVASLPAIYRDALLLTEFEGLSQVELAERLSLSVSAAKSRVQRARAMVRETIVRCCRVEVDRYGQIVNLTPRKSCSCE